MRGVFTFEIGGKTHEVMPSPAVVVAIESLPFEPVIHHIPAQLGNMGDTKKAMIIQAILRANKHNVDLLKIVDQLNEGFCADDNALVMTLQKFIVDGIFSRLQELAERKKQEAAAAGT